MTVTRLVAALGATALCATAGAPAAWADPEYPPTSPTRAAAVCVGDIPFLAYGVDFGDDSFVGEPMTITFVNPAGDDFVINTSVPAVDEQATVLWPGASVDPQDWPGWELNADGEWVETTADAGAFTRAPGGVEVQFTTNPTLTTTVTYPPASAVCANPPRTGDTPGAPSQQSGDAAPGAETIPQTGASAVLPLALGLLGLGIGGGLVFAARRRA
jgi:LPXTG-motif cell wall-anchored protein